MEPGRHKGQLTKWNDERGFGFISPDNKGPQVFVHISALQNGNRRPKIGDIIFYQLTTDKSGKNRACNAIFQDSLSQATPKTSTSKSSSNASPNYLTLCLEILVLAALPIWGSIHLAITEAQAIPLILYPVMSIVTYCIYAEDKLRAKQNRWRVAESTLHICEMLGGWIGGFVAQQILRHKNRKRTYQVVFWAIAFLHLGVWLNWLFFGGSIIKLFLSE